MIDYQVGQRLYFVPVEKSFRPYFVEVKKVGNKWVHLSNNQKVEKNSNRPPSDYGCGYTGTLYETEEEYKKESELSYSWDLLRRKIDKQYNPPKNITIEKINQILELLKE